jgi:hypothetical protein
MRPHRKVQVVGVLAMKGTEVGGLSLPGYGSVSSPEEHGENKAPSLWLAPSASKACLLEACVVC